MQIDSTGQGVSSFVSNPNNFEPPVSGKNAPVLSEKGFSEVMEWGVDMHRNIYTAIAEKNTKGKELMCVENTFVEGAAAPCTATRIPGSSAWSAGNFIR